MNYKSYLKHVWSRTSKNHIHIHIKDFWWEEIVSLGDLSILPYIGVVYWFSPERSHRHSLTLQPAFMRGNSTEQLNSSGNILFIQHTFEAHNMYTLTNLTRQGQVTYIIIIFISIGGYNWFSLYQLQCICKIQAPVQEIFPAGFSGQIHSNTEIVFFNHHDK